MKYSKKKSSNKKLFKSKILSKLIFLDKIKTFSIVFLGWVEGSKILENDCKTPFSVVLGCKC